MIIEGKNIKEYNFFRELVATPLIEEIYLTGSRARGDQDAHSNIDLAIACPMASDADWEQIHYKAHYNNEILLRVDALRLDAITDEGHRNFVLHKRQLLFLRTYGGDDIVTQRKAAFFDDWHKKLTGWINYLPKQTEPLDAAQQKQLVDSFQACVNCIWIMLRKALATDGHYVNTPLTTFHDACLKGWINDRILWERITADYHLTKHPLSPSSFSDFQQRVPVYIKTIQNSANSILTRIKPYIYEHKAI
jgi:predicted nucleotidyltransferase